VPKKPAAIPEVIDHRVKKGKSLTPIADRDGGPKRRPDGTIIPPETELVGCQCQTPCLCANPEGYLTPWMVNREASFEAEAKQEYDTGTDADISGVLDADLHKVGKRFTSDNEGPVIVSRFGRIQKMIIADTENAQTTIAILQEALKDSRLTPEDRQRVRELLADAESGEPHVGYMDNDELPLPDAAKRLGYDGILVWENDDVSDPSSVFLWNVSKAKPL
jgi:hypothetical protein